MVRTPCSPGLPARAAAPRRARSSCSPPPSTTSSGRSATSSARTLGPGGFDPARDIRAITVNRWPHGYAYQYNSLWDPFWLEGGAPPCEIARRPLRPHRHRQRRRRRLLVRGRGHRPGAPRRARGHGLSDARPALRPRPRARRPAAVLGLRHPHHRHPRLRGQHGRHLVHLVGASRWSCSSCPTASSPPSWARPGRAKAASTSGCARRWARAGEPGRLVLLDQQRLLDARRSTWCSRAPSTRSSCARTCRPACRRARARPGCRPASRSSSPG